MTENYCFEKYHFNYLSLRKTFEPYMHTVMISSAMGPIRLVNNTLTSKELRIATYEIIGTVE